MAVSAADPVFRQLLSLCQSQGPKRCALAGGRQTAPQRAARLFAQAKRAPMPAPKANPPGPLTYGDLLASQRQGGRTGNAGRGPCHGRRAAMRALVVERDAQACAAKPRPRKIVLALVKHLASAGAARAGTLFVNPGGPGGLGTVQIPDSFLAVPEGGARALCVSWRGSFFGSTFGRTVRPRCCPDLDSTLTRARTVQVPRSETRISLGGELAGVAGGRPLDQALRGRLGRLLFAYLVLNRDRAVTRGELVDGLWGESPPDASATTLNRLLSRIRSGLGADVLQGRSPLRLVLEMRGGRRSRTCLVAEAQAGLRRGPRRRPHRGPAPRRGAFDR
jgi:hypothetical protein